MIQDVDETIKQLLIQKAGIDPEQIEIMFERPDTEWESRIGTKPTINAFLFEIRENLKLRYDQQQYISRSTDNRTGVRRINPARIDLLYQMTVWSQEMGDEHRLLGNILKTLIRYPILPDDILQGELVDQPLPVRAWIAQPEDLPKVWEFWGANEWRLKSSLIYRVTIAIEPVLPVEVDLVQTTQTLAATQEIAH